MVGTKLCPSIGICGIPATVVGAWTPITYCFRDREEILERIRTGAGAHNFRGMGDQRRLLVTNRVADTISSIDMNEMTVLDTLRVAGGPDCMDLGADGRMLWVTSRWTKRVVLVDLAERRVVRTIPVGRSPHGIYLHNRAAAI